MDFLDLTSDSGLYVFSKRLRFYPLAAVGPLDVIEADEYQRLVLTRDGGTNVFAGYIDGAEQFSFVDDGALAVFNPGIVKFFNDDNATGAEASAGVVDRIELYDAALTAMEVGALGGPAVPEPGTTMLTCLGLAALFGSRRRA